jgi:hypothetical protein
VRSAREEGSVGLRSGNLRPSMLAATGGFVLIRDGVFRSYDPYVGFEPSPRACQGGGTGNTWDPHVLQPVYWL